MALEVPSLVAAAVPLTAVNASTQLIEPAPASAIKGECCPSFYLKLQQGKAFPSPPPLDAR